MTRVMRFTQPLKEQDVPWASRFHLLRLVVFCALFLTDILLLAQACTWAWNQRILDQCSKALNYDSRLLLARKLDLLKRRVSKLS